VNVVVFSPDGSRIATVGAGESALVIDLATEAELVLIHHDRGVNAVAFSPDGTRIITGGRDGSARVIDIATGEQLARLDPDYAGHPDYRVNAVAFSPDGTRIATGGGGEYSSGSARVFDAATWTELTRLDHDYPVNVVAFSPDGTRIATASGSSAQMFEIAPELLLQRAFGVMTRPLNPTELRRYSLAPDCKHVKEWRRKKDVS